MEVTQIKNALKSMTNIGKTWNRNNLLIFLQNVLGYTLNDDLLPTKLIPPVQPVKEINLDPKIKFAAALLPSANLSAGEQNKLVLEIALAAATNIVMLPQNDKIIFYSVDWEENRQIDILVAVDLAKDNPEDVAQQLWALAKKDCGRKILVGV